MFSDMQPIILLNYKNVSFQEKVKKSYKTWQVHK